MNFFALEFVLFEGLWLHGSVENVKMVLELLWQLVMAIYLSSPVVVRAFQLEIQTYLNQKVSALWAVLTHSKVVACKPMLVLTNSCYQMICPGWMIVSHAAFLLFDIAWWYVDGGIGCYHLCRFYWWWNYSNW